jgi:hypothetical protein
MQQISRVSTQLAKQLRNYTLGRPAAHKQKTGVDCEAKSSGFGMTQAMLVATKMQRSGSLDGFG